MFVTRFLGLGRITVSNGVYQVIPLSAFIGKEQNIVVPTRSCIGIYVARFKLASSPPCLRWGTSSPFVRISKFDDENIQALTHDACSHLATGELVRIVCFSHWSHLYQCKCVDQYVSRVSNAVKAIMDTLNVRASLRSEIAGVDEVLDVSRASWKPFCWWYMSSQTDAVWVEQNFTHEENSEPSQRW